MPVSNRTGSCRQALKKLVPGKRLKRRAEYFTFCMAFPIARKRAPCLFVDRPHKFVHRSDIHNKSRSGKIRSGIFYACFYSRSALVFHMWASRGRPAGLLHLVHAVAAHILKKLLSMVLFFLLDMLERLPDRRVGRLEDARLVGSGDKFFG